MSDNEKTLEIQVISGAEGQIAAGYTYGAEQAREYANEAAQSAEKAKESQNLAEAWSHSDQAPAGEGTRSAKTWSNVSKEWAESTTAPDNTTGSRSAKTWADVARQWAESDKEPDGVKDAKSAKTWAGVANDHANTASLKANAAAASANTASLQAQAAATSAQTATTKASEASTSANNAAVSAKAAADKYTALVNEDLTKKADLAGADFTGKVTVPTAPAGTNDAQAANTAFVMAAIAAMVDGSPEALDTLKELATALGNDPNFATTITNLIATKLDKTGTAVKATGDAAGNDIQKTYATKEELNKQGGSLATVATTGSYTDLLNLPAIPSKTSELTNDSRYVSTDENGNVVLTGTLTATQVFNAVYNDYAEFFPRGGDTERGDIIACDETSTWEKYVKATDKSRCVVGVHSEEFAQIIGGLQVEEGKGVMETNIRQFIPVAMAGRVHVKYFGKAIVGTKVVPSEIPGVGRAWQEGDSLDHVVGRIVEPDTRQDIRLVKILVGR